MVTANCYVVVRPLKVTAHEVCYCSKRSCGQAFEGPWLHSMAPTPTIKRSELVSLEAVFPDTALSAELGSSGK